MYQYAHKLNEGIRRRAWKLQGYYRFYDIHFRDCNLLVASPYAPQSVLSALASVNLSVMLFGLRCYWGKILVRQTSRVSLHLWSIVLVVIFGNQCSLSYTADEIVRLFLAVGQMLYFLRYVNSYSIILG